MGRSYGINRGRNSIIVTSEDGICVEITLLGGILLNEFAVNTELLFIPLQPLGWVLVLSGLAAVLSVILKQEWAGGIIEA